MLVQIEKIHSFFEDQGVHVVLIRFLQPTVEGSQHILRGQLVLQRGLTRAHLLCIEGLSLSDQLLQGSLQKNLMLIGLTSRSASRHCDV